MEDKRWLEPMSIEVALTLSELLDSDTAKFDVELILCYTINCERAYLRTWPERVLSESQQQQFRQLFNKRLEGVPVAYITKSRDFWSLDLAVSEHTLIPRPDTEVLVEASLGLDMPANATVLDLGTGTGAIALALASENPGWQVLGVDKYPEIVTLAASNAHRNDIDNAHFILSNWFDSIEKQMFDLIVSNPPYIDPSDSHLEQGDVRFEPLSALTSDNKGLADIQLIIAGASNFLSSNGWLVFEHGFDQAKDVQRLLEEAGFVNIATKKDYSGNDRVTMGQQVC